MKHKHYFGKTVAWDAIGTTKKCKCGKTKILYSIRLGTSFKKIKDMCAPAYRLKYGKCHGF